MKILITGCTGFIGQQLAKSLLQENHEVTGLTRNKQRAKKKVDLSMDWIETLANATERHYDAIINLAGAPIDRGYWTEKRKQTLLTSRLTTTHAIIEYIKQTPVKPKFLISGSAIGFYGPQPHTTLTENSPTVESFTHQLCQQWEAKALKATNYGIRVCLLRTGVVLGQQGGMLKRLNLPFKLGMGGKLGTGQQWLSWIHIADLIELIKFLLVHPQLSGPINATAPYPVHQANFARQFAQALHRSTWLNLPESVVKLLFGQLGTELLISGQKVVPQQITQAGFEFQYPELSSALKNLVGGS
jgi:uncharacterized protein (TIGR01777 family)